MAHETTRSAIAKLRELLVPYTAPEALRVRVRAAIRDAWARAPVRAVPPADDGALAEYHALHWRSGSTEHWIVSTLSADELRRLVDRLRAGDR